jgi:membrane protease subunit (stomatin/prohibitin family)
MSNRLRSRALGLMRQLDAGGGYKEQIQKEINERLGAQGAQGAQGACAECETQNDPDAKFCKNCGAKL